MPGAPIPYTPPQSTFVPGTSPPFSYQELDMMRTYMVTPVLFSTPGALLEGVFQSINGLVNNPLDMGYTQFAIRQTLFNLVQLETQLFYLENAPIMAAIEIEGKIITDPQGTAFIYRYIDGPALIQQLSSRLAYPPFDNYFAPVRLAEPRDRYVANAYRKSRTT